MPHPYNIPFVNAVLRAVCECGEEERKLKKDRREIRTDIGCACVLASWLMTGGLTRVTLSSVTDPLRDVVDGTLNGGIVKRMEWNVMETNGTR